MSCAHPINIRFRDYRLHAIVPLQVPCGKCASCLREFSRGWEFRIKQTAYKSDGFIYDTLTLRPDDMPVMDFTEFFQDGILYFPAEYCCDGAPHFRTPSDGSVKLLEHYHGMIPYLPKSVLSKWLDQSRNALNQNRLRHGQSRADIRYAAVLEYGPKYARSHVHIIVFGVTRWEYEAFFASRWRFQYGFTKTKWIDAGSRSDAGRVAGYLAKYFTKGSDYCPLQKDGILPKPWRLLSHGLGREYLDSSRTHLWNYLGIPKNIWDALSSLDVNTVPPYVLENARNIIETAFSSLKTQDKSNFIDVYNTAYDGKYPLSLPRYYRAKIVNKACTSVLSHVLSSLLIEDNCKRRFVQVATFASGLLGKPLEEVLLAFDQNQSLYCRWLDKFSSFERYTSKAKEHSSIIKRRNFFQRSQRAEFAGILIRE